MWPMWCLWLVKVWWGCGLVTMLAQVRTDLPEFHLSSSRGLSNSLVSHP